MTQEHRIVKDEKNGFGLTGGFLTSSSIELLLGSTASQGTGVLSPYRVLVDRLQAQDIKLSRSSLHKEKIWEELEKKGSLITVEEFIEALTKINNKINSIEKEIGENRLSSSFEIASFIQNELESFYQRNTDTTSLLQLASSKDERELLKKASQKMSITKNVFQVLSQEKFYNSLISWALESL